MTKYKSDQDKYNDLQDECVNLAVKIKETMPAEALAKAAEFFNANYDFLDDGGKWNTKPLLAIKAFLEKTLAEKE